MKHWWWRSKEVNSENVVMDNGQFYPTIWFKFPTKNTGRLPLLLFSNQLLETVYIVLIWSHILTKCSSGMYVYTRFHLVPHFDEMFHQACIHQLSFGPTFWEMFTRHGIVHKCCCYCENCTSKQASKQAS